MGDREFDNAAAAVRDHGSGIASDETEHRRHKDLDGAIVDHSERLYALEGKVFPRLWPTIQRVGPFWAISTIVTT